MSVPATPRPTPKSCSWMDMDSRLTAAAVSWPTTGKGLGGCGIDVCAGPGPRVGVHATSSAESELSAAESSCDVPNAPGEHSGPDQ